MIAIKKRIATANSKALKTNDLIDPVTNLLYHGYLLTKFKNLLHIVKCAIRKVKVYHV